MRLQVLVDEGVVLVDVDVRVVVELLVVVDVGVVDVEVDVAV